MDDDESEKIMKAGQGTAFGGGTASSEYDDDNDDNDNDNNGGPKGKVIPKLPSLGEVKDKVVEGVKNVGGKVADAARNVADGAKDIGSAVKDKVGEKVGEVKENIDEKISDMKADSDKADTEDYRHRGIIGDDIAEGEFEGEDRGGEGPTDKPAEIWNETVRHDSQRKDAFDEAKRQAKAARAEKRHMAYMNAAKAIAPQLAMAGVKSYADMLGNVRTLTNNFLNGQGMSTASTLLGDTLSSADTSANMLRRSSQDFGILQNADMEAIKDTAKGRMMMARNKAEQEGVAFANVMIGKALAASGKEDISQLDMDDVVNVYNECRAGMQRAQDIIKNPESSRGDKHHAAGMLQQYRDVMKGLDSRNKELGRIAREDAAWLTTQERDANRQRRAQSAAELQARYDNGTDAQKWAWTNLFNGRYGVDLDENGVPSNGKGLGGHITTLDKRLQDMRDNGVAEDDPEYKMVSQLRQDMLDTQRRLQDERYKDTEKYQTEQQLQQKYDSGNDVQKWVWDTFYGGKAKVDLFDNGIPMDNPSKLQAMVNTLDYKIQQMESSLMGPSTSYPGGTPEYQMLTQLRDNILNRKNALKEEQKQREKEGKRRPDMTFGGYESRRQTKDYNNMVISDLYDKYGLPNDGRTLAELRATNPALADKMEDMMQDPEYIHASNEIAYNENADMIDNLRNALKNRGGKFGITPEKASAIINKMKGIQMREIQLRQNNEANGVFTDPNTVTELNDYNEYFDNVLSGRNANVLANLKQKRDKIEATVPESQRQFNGEWHALNDAIEAMGMVDPGNDPRGALEARDVAYALADVKIEGARGKARERKAKAKAEEKKQQTADQREAETHRKASEGKLSPNAYDDYIKELQQKVDADGKDTAKNKRKIKAARVGQSYKYVADITDKLLRDGYIDNDQYDALTSHINDLKNSMLSVYNGEGRQNYRVPQATIDEWERVGRYLDTMTSKENTTLRSNMRRELDKRKFDDDDTEKKAIQELYNVLTDTSAISSTNGDTRDYQTRIDEARQYLNQVREDNMREIVESSEAAGSSDKQRAAMKYSTAEMNKLVEEAGFGMLPSYDIDKIEDPEIREFMTTNPDFIKAHNRWVNNRNQLLYDTILKRMGDGKNLGWDSTKLMSVMGPLETLLRGDKEKRAGNDQYLSPNLGFGAVAPAYKDIFDARLENLNDKNDISLRALEDKILTYEKEHENEPISALRNDEKYKIMVELKDALSDDDITPLNVVDKAKHIRDLRAKLLGLRSKDPEEKKEEPKPETGGKVLSDQDEIEQVLSGKAEENAAKQDVPKEIKQKGPRTGKWTPERHYIEDAINNGEITQEQYDELKTYFNKTSQKKGSEISREFNRQAAGYKADLPDDKKRILKMRMNIMAKAAERKGLPQAELDRMQKVLGDLDKVDVKDEDPEIAYIRKLKEAGLDDDLIAVLASRKFDYGGNAQTLIPGSAQENAAPSEEGKKEGGGNVAEQQINLVDEDEESRLDAMENEKVWSTELMSKRFPHLTAGEYKTLSKKHPEITQHYLETNIQDPKTGKTVTGYGYVDELPKQNKGKKNSNKRTNTGYVNPYSSNDPIDTSSEEMQNYLKSIGWEGWFDALNEAPADSRKAIAPLLNYLADKDAAKKIFNYDQASDADKIKYDNAANNTKRNLFARFKDAATAKDELEEEFKEILADGSMSDDAKKQAIKKVEEDLLARYKKEEEDKKKRGEKRETNDNYDKVAYVKSLMDYFNNASDENGLPNLDALGDDVIMKLAAQNISDSSQDVNVKRIMQLIKPKTYRGAHKYGRAQERKAREEEKAKKIAEEEAKRKEANTTAENVVKAYLTNGWDENDDWIKNIVSNVSSGPRTSTGQIINMLNTVKGDNVTEKMILSNYAEALSDLYNATKRSSGKGLKGANKEAYQTLARLKDRNPDSMMKAALALALKRTGGSGDVAAAYRAVMNQSPVVDYTSALTIDGEAIAKSHTKRRQPTK